MPMRKLHPIIDIRRVTAEPYFLMDLVYRYNVSPLSGVPIAIVKGRASFPNPFSCLLMGTLSSVRQLIHGDIDWSIIPCRREGRWMRHGRTRNRRSESIGRSPLHSKIATLSPVIASHRYSSWTLVTWTFQATFKFCFLVTWTFQATFKL